MDDVPPLPGSQAARVQEMLREDDPNSLNRLHDEAASTGSDIEAKKLHSCKSHSCRIQCLPECHQVQGLRLRPSPREEDCWQGHGDQRSSALALTPARTIRAPLQRLGSGAAWIAERRHQARRILVKVEQEQQRLHLFELEQLRTGSLMTLLPRSSN